MSKRIALVLYVAVLFTATHCPLSGHVQWPGDTWAEAMLADAFAWGGDVFMGHGRDKLTHFTAYTVLTWLAFAAAATFPRRREAMRSGLGWLLGLGVVLVLLGYGLFDEATQPIFGRTFEWLDYAANAAGIMLTTGALACVICLRGMFRETQMELVRR